MKVIIIGGGFAGLALARKLNNQDGFDVLLLDRLTYHQFQPLFYQVATASLEAANISFPFRKLFHGSKNVRIRITEVLELKLAEKTVLTDSGEFPYDRLVLATGTTTNFFGNEQLKQLALPMKSVLEALQLMNRVINNFEDALDLTTDVERSSRMSIAVVGAGPTGVELAGALAEMKANILPKDYPDLNLNLMHIYLIDHGGQPLATMSESSGADARRYLEDMGIALKLECGVKSFDGKQVLLDDGSLIDTCTVIWAAGVTGALPKGIVAGLLEKGSRIRVDRYNKVQGLEEVYAIGDICFMGTEKYPHGHPQLASVAGDQAKLLGKNFINISKGKSTKAFEYVNKGVMATIGKRKAVVDLEVPKWHLNGRLAWLIWMFLHLFLILGVKNKIQVFINWAYKYFTSDQSLRLARRFKGKFSNIETDLIN